MKHDHVFTLNYIQHLIKIIGCWTFCLTFYQLLDFNITSVTKLASVPNHTSNTVESPDIVSHRD